MTLKSLCAQAPTRRDSTSVLQQNCFEAHCRTGVLKGGKVEDTSTDIDYYNEFAIQMKVSTVKHVRQGK